MTTADDADRDMLVHICDSLGVYPGSALIDAIVRAGFRRFAPSAPTPPEAGEDAEEQIAYWQRAAHEIEQELTKECATALADAAAKARALDVINEELSPLILAFPWVLDVLDAASAALDAVAPAAKEG